MLNTCLLVYCLGALATLAFVAWRDPYGLAAETAQWSFAWPLLWFYVLLFAVTWGWEAWLRRPEAWRWAFATVCWSVPWCAFAIHALLQPGLSPWMVLLQALAAAVHIALVAASIGVMRECGGAQ